MAQHSRVQAARRHLILGMLYTTKASLAKNQVVFSNDNMSWLVADQEIVDDLKAENLVDDKGYITPDGCLVVECYFGH